jgi:hypothetical protein
MAQHTLNQYCVYSQSPYFAQVIEWLSARHIDLDPHLNRTRFVITDPQQLLEFLLTWADHCPRVPSHTDPVTGLADTLDRDLGVE